jgi:hypothetical protein
LVLVGKIAPKDAFFRAIFCKLFNSIGKQKQKKKRKKKHAAK